MVINLYELIFIVSLIVSKMNRSSIHRLFPIYMIPEYYGFFSNLHFPKLRLC